MSYEVCRHGSMKRKCETCEAWAEVDELRAALETAERDTEARIAAWMRANGGRHPAAIRYGYGVAFAEAIERGDHRKGAE